MGRFRATVAGLTKTELLLATADALRASFPERAEGLLGALERRLSGGPWTLALERRHTMPLEIGRDALLAEVARALRRDAMLGETRVARIERWLADSSRLACVSLLGGIDLGSEYPARVSLWAMDALEAGHDSGSLRILAGLSDTDASHEHRGWQYYVRRAFDELSWPWPQGNDPLAENLRQRARDIALGELTATAAAEALGDLGVWGPIPDVPQLHRLVDLGQRIRWANDDYPGPAALERMTVELAEAFSAVLASVPDPDE